MITLALLTVQLSDGLPLATQLVQTGVPLRNISCHSSVKPHIPTLSLSFLGRHRAHLSAWTPDQQPCWTEARDMSMQIWTLSCQVQTAVHTGVYLLRRRF